MENLVHKNIFFSYASPDLDRVIPFYDYLHSEGYKPWIDIKQLLPGQNWEFEIERAIDLASLIIIFVSNKSINRTGYVQKELRVALDKLQQRPLDQIYVIPIILDKNVSIPKQLRDIHYLYADLPDCFQKLKNAIDHQLKQLESTHEKLLEGSDIKFTFENFSDDWDGLPGYEIDVYLPLYKSDKYPLVNQAGDIIRGYILSSAAGWRICKIDQHSDHYRFDNNKYIRTNQYRTSPLHPIFHGPLLSQRIDVHWYGAGAAHPNVNILTWVFLLDPLISVEGVASLFNDSTKALSILQLEIRKQLKQKLGYADDWVKKGTSTWQDFRAFTLEKEGLAVAFPPYQVAPYASGPQFILIPYDKIISIMKPIFRKELEIS